MVAKKNNSSTSKKSNIKRTVKTPKASSPRMSKSPAKKTGGTKRKSSKK